MDYDRPTVELKLPETEAVVTLYGNMTTGDYRKIQRAVMNEMKVKVNPSDPSNPDIQDISGAVTMDQEEAVLDCLLVSATDKDGNQIENLRQFVYNLPIKDGDVLYAKVNELSANSSMGKDRKKK